MDDMVEVLSDAVSGSDCTEREEWDQREEEGGQGEEREEGEQGEEEPPAPQEAEEAPEQQGEEEPSTPQDAEEAPEQQENVEAANSRKRKLKMEAMKLMSEVVSVATCDVRMLMFSDKLALKIK